MQSSTESKSLRPNFSIKPGKLFINNEFRDGGDGNKTNVIDPTTEEILTQVVEANEEDTEAAIKAASHAFNGGPWRQMSGHDRAEYLWRIGDLITKYGEELAFLQAKEMGRLYSESMAIDIPHLTSLYHYYAGLASIVEGSVKQAARNAHVYTLQEPLGVVGAISPFNFPLVLAAQKFAPALATGNCVVHKPASSTPLSAVKMAEIMQEAGLPTGVFNLVTGSGSVVGNLLSTHPNVEKVAITGSTGSGVRVIESSADTVKHLTMELGGKSANIVFADADLKKINNLAFYSIFDNKGEICYAGSRMLVERSVYDEVIEQVRQKAASLKLGDPLDSETQVGPIASKSEYDNVLRYMDIGQKDGARLVTGGKAADIGTGKGYFVEPTVFADVEQSMTIAQEETFGPILVIIPFDTFEDAIKIANSSQYGLAAGIQSRDLNKVHRAAAQLEAGIIWVNTYGQFDPSCPFGGYKMSGYGRELGRESLQYYLQTKTVWIDLSSGE
ncbi:MAG: aldehyde dehydrogenase family protein [Cyanophyceae cyanobacterium]